jgi:hypothetical protein
VDYWHLLRWPNLDEYDVEKRRGERVDH